MVKHPRGLDTTAITNKTRSHDMASDSQSESDQKMHWIPLTQANTGMTIHVNMDLVVLVAPSKDGGSNLMLTVRELSKNGRDTARLVPTMENPDQIMHLLIQGAN